MIGKIVPKITTKIKNKVGLADHNFPQFYDSQMSIWVTNKSKRAKKVSIISPLPLKKYQSNILSKLIISTAGSMLSEPKYGNQYICWSDTIKAGEMKEFIFHFDINTAPTKILLNPVWTLEDYKVDHKDLIWLGENKYIHPSSPKIIELSKEIIEEETNLLTIILKISQYINDLLEYGNPIPGLYSDFDAIKKKKVDCGGFSTLFISICRSIGIPARLVAGYWADRPGKEMHAWAEFVTPDGEWVPVDLSIEWLRTKGKENKLARLGVIGSDRIAMSYGCDYDILENTKNQTNVDILQTPFSIPEDEELVIKYRLDSKSIKNHS